MCAKPFGILSLATLNLKDFVVEYVVLIQVRYSFSTMEKDLKP